MDKALTGIIGVVLGLGMLVVFANMAQGAVPQPQFTCPICGVPFFTYDELYQHFISAHPAEPIEILWE